TICSGGWRNTLFGCGGGTCAIPSEAIHRAALPGGRCRLPNGSAGCEPGGRGRKHRNWRGGTVSRDFREPADHAIPGEEFRGTGLACVRAGSSRPWAFARSVYARGGRRLLVVTGAGLGGSRADRAGANHTGRSLDGRGDRDTHRGEISPRGGNCNLSGTDARGSRGDPRKFVVPHIAQLGTEHADIGGPV